MVNQVEVTGGKKLKLALLAMEKKLSRPGVLRVGFQDGATYPPSTNAKFLKAVGSKAKPKENPILSIAQVAWWNEFGTKTAPSRPFFRTTIAKRSKEWSKVLQAALKSTDYDGIAALNILGEAMVDDVTNSIAQWSDPPNAPLTIKIKGFDKPLLGTTKQMQRHVTKKVSDA